MVDPITAAIVVVGALTAASFYQQRKMQRQAEKQANEMASHQISGHDSNRALYTVYGRALVGTTTLYKRVSRKQVPMANASFTNYRGGGGSPDTSDKRWGLNRFLYRISSLSNGPIDGIEKVLIDGESHLASRFTAGHSRHFEAAVSLGPTAGNYFSNLKTTYSTDFNQWDASKKGQGVAYVVERFWFDKSNPAYQGEPQTQYLVRGRKLYDPRLDSTVTGGSGTHRSATPSTWAFSDNPALALLDMLTNTEYGRGVDYSECDLPSFITAANKCDTYVDIPARATNQTGSQLVVYDPHLGVTYEIADNGIIPNYRIDQITTGSFANKQKRFRLNMAVDNSKEVLDNIQQILQSFRANLHHINGEYVVHMDDVASPVITLNDDDIIGGLKISQGDRKQRINRMTAKFLNANKHYKTDQVSWPPLDETPGSQYQTYLTEDSGEKLHKTVTLTGCTDYYQAEDIAEYLVRESRVTLTATGTFGSRCFNLVPGDVIALDYDSAGYSGKYFIVDQVGVDISSMNVKLSLREYDSSIYTWNANRGNEPIGLFFDEEQQYNVTPTSPTIGTVSADSIALSDGTAALRLNIPFSDIPEEALSVEIGWSVQNADVYTSQVILDETATKAEFLIGIDDQVIDLRIRYFVANADGIQLPSGYTTTTFTLPAVSGTKLDNIEENATRNQVFQQDAQPSGGAYQAGDIWIDTNDNFKMYMYDSGAWVLRADSRIATALQDAAGAQSTADGKIDTFYQDDAPTSASEGDLWIDTNDDNKLYRHDGTNFQAARDSGIAEAIQDAATAQSTADGKITTFFAASTATPTAEGVGDMWYQTDNAVMQRWNGSTWNDVASYNTGDLADLNTVGNSQIDNASINIDKLDDLQSTNYSQGVSGWKLTKDGTFESGDGTFRGSVTSSSGTIGGWTLGTQSLTAGTGSNAVGIHIAKGIYLGATTFSSSPFRVNTAGEFTATNAAITGSITATSLTLNGTSIAESQLATGVQSSLGLADSALQDGDTSVNLGLDDGSIAGISIDSTKLYAGTGTWGHSNTGFYLDNTGKFSLKDKLFFNPTNNLLTVDGNITADVITAKENLVVLGDLEASSMAAGSITRAMFSQDALDEIYSALATSVGGSNGDYKEASGSFTTSGGTVTVGTASDKFDHGPGDVVVEFLANHFFYTTTNYTTAQAQATLNFEVSADGTFTDLTSATKTQVLQFGEYDLSSYYGYTYLVYFFNGEHSKTFTSGSGNDIPDDTELQFRVRVSGIGTAFTSQTVPFTVEANEGVTGVVSTGGNADTLDNLDSTKFLRSDVDDTFDADLTITGDLSLQGALNITGDINSYNVTDLDVSDKTITVNSGNTQALSDGAGLIVDRGTAADASLLWNETGDKFQISHPVILSGRNSDSGSSHGYVTSGTKLHDALTNVALELHTGSDDSPATIYFKSGVNAPSDFAYISYFPDYDGTSENGALVIGSENDGGGSSDYIRLQSRVVVDNNMFTSDNSTIMEWYAGSTQKAYLNTNGDLQLDGTVTWSGGTSTEANTAYDKKINTIAFASANGNLTLTRQDGTTAQTNLDGRYLTSYTETDTLDSVTDRGATTTNAISTGAISATGSNNVYAGTFTGGSGPSVTSNGVKIKAGANFNDTTLLVEALDGTDLFKIDGSGVGEFSQRISVQSQDVTSTRIQNWQTAYGWGDHSTQGYVTSALQTNDNITVGTISSGSITSTGNSTFSNLKVTEAGLTQYIHLYLENGTANIADDFTDTTTQKSYIYLNGGVGSNDPGFIMHETADSNTVDQNRGVLHLVPSDDNSAADYVSIHGTNDADCLRLDTAGRITTASNYRLELSSGSSSVYISDSLEVQYDVDFNTLTQNGTTRIDGSGNATFGTVSATGLSTFSNNAEQVLQIKGTGDTGAIHFFEGTTRRGILGFTNGAAIQPSADADDMILRSEESLLISTAATNHYWKFGDDGHLTANGKFISAINGNNTGGGNLLLGATGNNAAKWGSVVMRQFNSDTETEGYTIIKGSTADGVNNVMVGGGMDEQNAATVVYVMAASNTSTRNGTEIARFTTDGFDVRNNNLRITGTTVIASTRRIYASDGTVTKASFSFDGESNTGMYKYGTNQIGFTAGGNLMAYIQSGSTYGLVVQSKISATGGNSDNWNTAYTYSQVGHLPLAGGTMTGNLNFSNSGTTKRGIQGTVGTNDYWFFGGGATASNAGFVEIAAGDDGTTAGSYEPIYVRQYLGSPLTGTVQRTLTLLDNNGDTDIPNDLDVGGAITSSSQVTGTSLQARNDSGYGTIEVGGSIGAFIDLKKPATDDYDVRIVSDVGTGGRIQSNGAFDIDAAGNILFDADGGTIALRDNGSSMASFTTSAATFAGTLSSGAITSSGNITNSGILQVNVGAASHTRFRITRPSSTTAALYMGVDSSNNAMMAANNSALRIGKDVAGTFYEYLTVESGGNTNVKNTLEIDGTAVIDSSRNLVNINNANAVSFLSTNGYWSGGTQRMNGSGDLVNIGTISSGAITSSGNITTFNGISANTTNSGSNYFHANSSDGRVLRLRDRSANGGNIVQFENGAGTNLWELVGRDGMFYIYKNSGTGSGYKWQIDSNGAHTITGNATFSADVTVAGDLKLGDTDRIELGDDTDLKISHSGGGGTVENDTGNLTIKNRAVDGDIYFQSDDGTGSGTDTYFYLDGGEKKVKFNEAVEASSGASFSGNVDYVLTVTSSQAYASRFDHSRANSAVNFSDALWLRNTNSNNSNYVSIGMTTTGTDGAHHRAQLRASRDGSSDYAGKFEIYTRDSSAGSGLGLRVDSNQDVSLPNGRIGVGKSVGTNDPALDVVGVNTTDGTARFRPDAAKGTRDSHLHYGSTGDWYIRSASGSGTVHIQDSVGTINLGAISSDLSFANSAQRIVFGSGGTNPSWSAPIIFRTASATLAVSDYSGVQLGGWNGTAYGSRFHVHGTGVVEVKGGILKGMSHLELLNDVTEDPTATSPRLYSPASATLGISMGGAERLRLNSTELSVSLPTPVIAGVDTNLTTRRWSIGGENGHCIIKVDPNSAQADSYFAVEIDNTERLALDNDGLSLVSIVSNSSATDCGIVHPRENLDGVPLEDGLAYFAFNHNTTSHPTSESAFDTMERDNITTFKQSGTWDNASAFTLSADAYLTEFHGYLLITTAGNYRFGVNADDAVDMYIDGVRVADDYDGHGATGFFNDESRAEIYLELGYHKVFARFEEVGGGDSIQLGWNGGSGTTLSAIPTGKLFHCAADRLKSYNGTIYGVGNLTMTANVTAYSDEKLKSDIETLDGSKVYDMRGVSFTKDGEAGSGVIAQELEKVAPELVHDGEYKSVAYGNLVGYLIEAVKDQKEIIDNLTQRIEELENGNH